MLLSDLTFDKVVSEEEFSQPEDIYFKK
jgi:hypothetical protein